MIRAFSRYLVVFLVLFGLSYGPSAFAATAKKPAPAPARITYIKGATPVFIGDYPNSSMQVTVKNQTYTITAPGTGAAVSNVFVPSHPKNADAVYLSTMTVGGKNTPTSLIYEYNLKTGKTKLLFSEKNVKRTLRVAGIDGANLLLVQSTQAIDVRCSSLWNGSYTLFTLDTQKPKTPKAYPIPAPLKKLAESEEQACKQSFSFKK